MTTSRRRGLGTPDPERRGGGNQSKFIPYIQLKGDLDRVRFRPLSEIDGDVAKAKGSSSVVLVGEFHEVPDVSRNGKKFSRDIICGFDMEGDADGSESCVHCDNGIDRRTRFLCWVYVYAYFHQTQNPEYNPRDPKTEDRKWDLVKLGETKAYKETVEAPLVWKDGFYMRNDLKDMADMNGCLTDRDYLVTRRGAPRDTQTKRTLKELQVSEINPEFLEQLRELPSLEMIATGEIETMDGATVEAPVEHEEVPLDELPDEFGGESGLGDDPFADLPDDLEHLDNPTEGGGDDDLDALPF